MKTVEDRIGELETRMGSIQDTLDLLKKYIERGGKVDSVEQEKPHKPTPTEKFNSLTDVERNKIDNIMENFDFDEVADVMEHLKWCWAGAENGVPNVMEIRNSAERLLIDAAYEKTTVATGGLRAVYEKDEEDPDDPFIQLEFILTDCEGFDEDDDGDDTNDWEDQSR